MYVSSLVLVAAVASISLAHSEASSNGQNEEHPFTFRLMASATGQVSTDHSKEVAQERSDNYDSVATIIPKVVDNFRELNHRSDYGGGGVVLHDVKYLVTVNRPSKKGGKGGSLFGSGKGKKGDETYIVSYDHGYGGGGYGHDHGHGGGYDDGGKFKLKGFGKGKGGGYGGQGYGYDEYGGGGYGYDEYDGGYDNDGKYKFKSKGKGNGDGGYGYSGKQMKKVKEFFKGFMSKDKDKSKGGEPAEIIIRPIYTPIVAYNPHGYGREHVGGGFNLYGSGSSFGGGGFSGIGGHGEIGGHGVVGGHGGVGGFSDIGSYGDDSGHGAISEGFSIYRDFDDLSYGHDQHGSSFLGGFGTGGIDGFYDRKADARYDSGGHVSESDAGVQFAHDVGYPREWSAISTELMPESREFIPKPQYRKIKQPGSYGRTRRSVSTDGAMERPKHIRRDIQSRDHKGGHIDDHHGGHVLHGDLGGGYGDDLHGGHDIHGGHDVGNQGGYGDHHDAGHGGDHQGGGYGHDDGHKLVVHHGGYKPFFDSAPYKGPKLSPYDLLPKAKGLLTKSGKLGTDPVKESQKHYGSYHDKPIAHFGGFGGGGDRYGPGTKGYSYLVEHIEGPKPSYHKAIFTGYGHSDHEGGYGHEDHGGGFAHTDLGIGGYGHNLHGGGGGGGYGKGKGKGKGDKKGGGLFSVFSSSKGHGGGGYGKGHSKGHSKGHGGGYGHGGHGGGGYGHGGHGKAHGKGHSKGHGGYGKGLIKVHSKGHGGGGYGHGGHGGHGGGGGYGHGKIIPGFDKNFELGATDPLVHGLEHSGTAYHDDKHFKNLDSENVYNFNAHEVKQNVPVYVPKLIARKEHPNLSYLSSMNGALNERLSFAAPRIKLSSSPVIGSEVSLKNST